MADLMLQNLNLQNLNELSFNKEKRSLMQQDFDSPRPSTTKAEAFLNCTCRHLRT